MSGRLRVSARDGADARCPYCHDALDVALRSAPCDGCELVAHVDCWVALARCPTLGCGREAPPPPPAPPGPPTPFTVGGTTTVTPPAAPRPVVQGSRRERRRRGPRPPAPQVVAPAPAHRSLTGDELFVGTLLWLVGLIFSGGVAVWIAVSTDAAWTKYQEIDPGWANLRLIMGVASFLPFAAVTLLVLWIGVRASRRRPG